MNKKEAQQELISAIKTWKNGNQATVEFENGSIIDREGFEWFLSGAELAIEDIAEEDIEYLAVSYIDLYYFELFFPLN